MSELALAGKINGYSMLCSRTYVQTALGSSNSRVGTPLWWQRLEYSGGKAEGRDTKTDADVLVRKSQL